jgi:alkanesulfonate monooxygenase SsuD/methylene tetrahydromethanopterin reductase-like flavin-dependent oxidoreductase (luciferase family)
MLGFHVFAAETDEMGHFLASSMQQAFVNLRSGRPSRLKPPVQNYVSTLHASELAILDQTFTCAAIGSPETVHRQLAAFIAQTQADELMITSQIFDHPARLRSFEITADQADTAERTRNR